MMDILKILQDSVDDLVMDDLDFFETELATGEGYNKAYKEACRIKIKQVRRWLEGKASSPNEELTDPEENIQGRKKGKKNGEVVLVSPDALQPYKDVNPQDSVDRVSQDLEYYRKRSDYKSAFKDYAKKSEIIDAEFIDKHYSLFN